MTYSVDQEKEEPGLDEDGYPNAALLEAVKSWPWERGFDGLLSLVRDHWNWSEIMFSQTSDGEYAISTGGWSGNEDLIGALQENTMFWACCWVSSRRGGHYEFEVKGIHRAVPTVTKEIA